MTINIVSFPNLSKAIFDGAARAAGFFLVAADAIYEASFRRVLRSIIRTI